jgi:hypothetical protein
MYNRCFISVSLVSIFALTLVASMTDRLPWLDLLYFLSYIKLFISFAKYVPQVCVLSPCPSTSCQLTPAFANRRSSTSTVNPLSAGQSGTSFWMSPEVFYLCKCLSPCLPYFLF